jgi:homocysteine S-methyltransferase
MAPLIVDGGLATGLEALGHRLHPRLWSAGVFLDRPRAVEALHAAYLAAGAQVLISASYQMSFEGLAREGLNREQTTAALRATIDAARRACERAARPAIVAASVGPYGASLGDGSEYHGEYGVSHATLREFHRDRLRVLNESGADMLALETIPSLEEARVLAKLLDENDGLEAWVSFSCRDARHLRDGQPIERAAAMLDGCSRVTAIGVNCTAPQHVSGLMDAIRETSRKRVIVYPNSGEHWDASRRDWSPGSELPDFVDLAATWAAKGAWAVGGCCRIGPETIGRLALRLRGDQSR